MGFYENGLERIAALCVGSASIAFGALPDGAIEAGVGLSGLAGFIIGRSQKFGPECGRVRRSIQMNLLKDYQGFIQSEGGDWSLHADLEAAHQALQDCLGDCFIDRESLAKSAVTPLGFPGEAVLVVMKGLAEARPDLFSTDKRDTLVFRYARDVIKSGVTAAIENIDYYKQLEPRLMFEMAQALGELRVDVKEIKQSVGEIKDDYRYEIKHLTSALHASETEMVALLGFILEKRVARETIIPEVKNAYKKLTNLRESVGSLKSLSNEVPEILPLLEDADRALAQGAGFSLDNAESALRKADQRFLEIIEEREEQVKRDKENRAKLLGKRAEIAAVKFRYDEAVSLYRQQTNSLVEALGSDHPDVATSYNNFADNLRNLGKYKEAAPLYQKSLEIRELVLDADHPDVATSYNNLALNLDAQGKYAEAAPLHQTSLEIRERVLGADHPDVAMIYMNIAANLNGLKRQQEALEYLEKKSADYSCRTRFRTLPLWPLPSTKSRSGVWLRSLQGCDGNCF